MFSSTELNMFSRNAMFLLDGSLEADYEKKHELLILIFNLNYFLWWMLTLCVHVCKYTSTLLLINPYWLREGERTEFRAVFNNIPLGMTHSLYTIYSGQSLSVLVWGIFCLFFIRLWVLGESLKVCLQIYDYV